MITFNPQITKTNLYTPNFKNTVSFRAEYLGDSFEKSEIERSFSPETFDRAKRKVIKSIRGPFPKESMVLIEDDEIIFYKKGKKDYIVLDGLECDFSDPDRDITFVHSHPKFFCGATAPISIDDCQLLLTSPAIKRIYAFNKNGQYSMLERCGDYFSESEFERVDDEFFHKMGIVFPDKKRQMYEEFLQEYDEYKTQPKDLAKDYYYVMEFSKWVEEFCKYKSQEAFMHDFWAKNAPRLGLRYDTDYDTK